MHNSKSEPILLPALKMLCEIANDLFEHNSIWNIVDFWCYGITEEELLGVPTAQEQHRANSAFHIVMPNKRLYLQSGLFTYMRLTVKIAVHFSIERYLIRNKDMPKIVLSAPESEARWAHFKATGAEINPQLSRNEICFPHRTVPK